MKLSNKLLQYFAIAIIIVLIVTGISTTVAFRLSLTSYLNQRVEEEFQNKAEELSSIYSLSDQVNSQILARYASNQEIIVSVYNNDNKLIASFNGIKDYVDQDKKLVSKNFDLEDENGTKLGTIELSYLENFYLYNNSLKIFYTTLTKSYVLIICLAILLGLLLMAFLTNRLAKPISEMNNFTKDLKNGKYLSMRDDYNIFEIDELSTNLNYLSNTLSMQEHHRLSYAQDIAHELRTPLTNLLLHLEGIRDDIIEADNNTINILIAEVNRLNKMVNNLHLSFDKIADSTKVNLEEIDLSSLIEQVVETFKPKFEEKNISINKHCPEEIVFKLDKDKFTQVINNLTSNAIKAVDYDGKIEYRIDDFPNRTVITVKDDGVGMTKDEMKHIFERFYRVDSARNRETGGTGLGLAIAKNYIELMNGKILVNSQVNKGSEFIITLKK